MNSIKYYGIYIQNDGDTNVPQDTGTLSTKWSIKVVQEVENMYFSPICEVHVYTSYEDAKRIIKEVKTARFKSFASRDDATYFATYGSTSGPGNPSVVAESTPFRSPKRPEVYAFRKLVEVDDLQSVERIIWENPRYLIGIGDTPTIMQVIACSNIFSLKMIFVMFRCF